MQITKGTPPMNSRDFVYWLQGFFEISGASKISAEQAAVIQSHLNLVLTHETAPSVTVPSLFYPTTLDPRIIC
jgi:hypothetical protein